MNERSDLFAVIEAVQARRAQQREDRTTAARTVVDILTVASEKEPSIAFSIGDLCEAFRRLGLPYNESSIREALRRMNREGKVEYVGRSMRPNIAGATSAVPTYRLVK